VKTPNPLDNRNELENCLVLSFIIQVNFSILRLRSASALHTMNGRVIASSFADDEVNLLVGGGNKFRYFYSLSSPSFP